MDNVQSLNYYNQASIIRLYPRMLAYLLNHVIGVKGHAILEKETKCDYYSRGRAL